MRYGFPLPLLPLLWLACSSSPPAQSPTPEQTEEETSSWAKDESPPDSTTSSTCYPKCAELIEKAQELFQDAQRLEEGQERIRVHGKAGDAYVAVWRGCSLEKPHGKDFDCHGANQVVERMIESFEHAKREDRLIYAHLISRDRRWKQSASQDEQLLSAVQQAENRAKEHPDAPASLELFRMAAYGRMALGQASQANQLIQQYKKLSTKAEEESLLASSIGSALALNDAGKHADAQRALGTKPSKAPERLSILWLSESGRAAWGMNRIPAATAAFQNTLQSWETISSGELQKMLGGAEPWPIPDRERAVEAVGAAHFFFAEQTRSKAGKAPFPKYSGPKTTQGAIQYMNDSVAPYIQNRHRLLMQADEAYQKVSTIQPVAPTRWFVAAMSQVGQMWADLASDVMNAPIPPHIDEDEELKGPYKKTLQDSLQPVMNSARRAFEVCNDTATKAQIEDSYTRACSTWLENNP